MVSGIGYQKTAGGIKSDALREMEGRLVRCAILVPFRSIKSIAGIHRCVSSGQGANPVQGKVYVADPLITGIADV
ncbi:hypothetical protein D3C73_758200 [compost metagenome]